MVGDGHFSRFFWVDVLAVAADLRFYPPTILQENAFHFCESHNQYYTHNAHNRIIRDQEQEKRYPTQIFARILR